MDYLAYLEMLWAYLPYMVYTFVFLTFVPKSFGKIKSFAYADYEANRNKYHRCYAPDVCCHTLGEQLPKPKARKAVTRVYPKKNSPVVLGATVPTHEAVNNVVLRRQVQASAIQTQTNVNQIAKMFESGAATKKINRVIPTILPEIRMHAYESAGDEEENVLKKSAPLLSLQHRQENIENSANLLNQTTANNDWKSEPLPPLQRRIRTVPNTLNFGGTSATPSTISPAASSPLSSSPESSNVSSPVMRTAPWLNMKSSLEDIFAAIARNAEKNESFIYAGCNALSPVTSIEDILSQRRLSRPLSAYSISDLLNEEQPAGMDEAYVENFLRTLNKT